MFAPRTSTSDDSLSVEKRADRHVRRLVGFYAHLAAYVGVNAVLVVVNLLTSPGVFWAIWPILGWGGKLGAHAVAVFGLPAIAEWKERARRAYIRRHTGPPATSPVEAQGEDQSDGETEQLRRRVENLETIVTSADWDLLADLDDDPADARAATLAEKDASWNR